MNTLIFFSLFATLFALSFSQPLTPGGKVRPTIPKFYIAPAGSITDSQAAEVLLPSFQNTTLCPETDYPSGFSLRCDTETGPDFKTVVFRVAGQVYSKEFFPPYYIAENTRADVVRPFPIEDFGPAQKIRGVRLRVVCRVRTRMPVWIDLITMC